MLLKAPSLIFIMIAVPLLLVHRAEAQSSSSSPWNPQNAQNTFCGGETPPQGSATIPFAGCFVLSAGQSAAGVFASHNVVVSLNSYGQISYTVDSTLVSGSQRTASGTNLPFVQDRSINGMSFCLGTTDDSSCPSNITIFSRKPDRSVIFLVAECFPPDYRSCVVSQKMWDMAHSHQQPDIPQAKENPDKLVTDANKGDMTSQRKLYQNYAEEGDYSSSFMWMYILAGEGDADNQKRVQLIEAKNSSPSFSNYAKIAQESKMRANEWLKEHSTK